MMKIGMYPRNLLVFVILTLIFMLSVRGNGAGLKTGISTGWLEEFYFYHEKGTGNFVHEHYDSLSGTLQADTGYLRAGLGYSRHVLAYIYDNGSGEEKTDKYRISFLNISALAKHPFLFLDGRMLLWPGIGLEYSRNLMYKKDGEDITRRYNQLDDIYLLVGGGLDFEIIPGIDLTFFITAGYNVTPQLGDGGDIGNDFYGLRARVEIGCLYRR